MKMEKKNLNVTIWQALKQSVKEIDGKAVPGLVMFLLLIAIETGANMIAGLPHFGWIVTILLALLFGVFIGAWHIITERERNSIKQQSIAETSVKVVGGLSLVLLVVNLIRISKSGGVDWEKAWVSPLPTSVVFNGLDLLAVVLIVGAFGWHLFAYISWHENDRHRIDRRVHAEKMSELDAKEENSGLALRRAEIELLAIDAEETKVNELRVRFSHLDPASLNRILNNARKEVRDAFEKKYNVDLNGDGKIGEGAPQQRKLQQQPRQPVQFQPANAYQSATPLVSAPQVANQGTNYNLADLLAASGETAGAIRARYVEYGEFAAWCSGQFDHISGGNMRRIWGELNPTNRQRQQ